MTDLSNDISNQISNLLQRFLPYSVAKNEIGASFSVEEVELNGNDVILTFSPDNYTSITTILQDNATFTTAGFLTKIHLSYFKPVEGFDYAYAYQAVFSKNISNKFKTYDIISLKGFEDETYNTDYTILEIKNGVFLLRPVEAIEIVPVTTALGYCEIEFTAGYNNLVTISDVGENKVKYEIDPYSVYVVNSIADLTISNVKLYYYQGSVKAMDEETFKTYFASNNNASSSFLIINQDLNSSPIRRQSNRLDVDYLSMNRRGSFEKALNFSISYIVRRKVDDSNNQTSSGGDINLKHLMMHEALTSILRSPMVGNDKITYSAPTIGASSNAEVIIAGSITIKYELSLTAFYSDNILVTDDEPAYPIAEVKINKDIIKQ
jgi:hypothetical protein